MKKIPYILIAILLVCILVFGTSPQKNQGIAEPSAALQVNSALSADVPEVPEADPTPTPVVYYDVTVLGKTVSTGNRKLDLSSIKPSDVDAVCEVLQQMPNLAYADIGDESNGLTWADLDKLYAAAPNARFSYGFTLYNQSLNTYDKILDFNHCTMYDEGEAVRQILPYMRNCSTLDMDSCGVSNEAMAKIREEFPDIDVIWRIWMATGYSFRTNVTKVLASKPSWGGNIYNEDAQQFKYCNHLKFIDLGHNEELSDFSFISYLTDLRVAVISITQVSDLTPFENCKKLFYLEAGNTRISNLKPLAQCTSLQHLNVGTCFDVTDITPLYDLDLKRLWLGSGDPVPPEQVQKMRELHPGIEIDTTCPTGLEGGAIGANEGFVMGKWKSYKQYLAQDWAIKEYTGSFPSQKPKGIFRIVYDGFEYALNPLCYNFTENDPLVNEHDTIYGSTRGAPVDMTEDPESGRVIYLTNDAYHMDAWNAVAAAYTQKTGVPVTVKTGEALSDALTDVDVPTMFEINGSADLRTLSDSCLDIKDSDVYNQLTSKEYITYTKAGEALGVARNITSYGILVNKPLLATYGRSVDEIKDYDSLVSVVADITAARNVTSSSAAFVSAPMGDITETGLTNRLVNIPIVSEFKEDGVGIKDVLDGTFLDKFHTFWDLIIYNMNCSYYDLNPTYVQRTNEDACREFLNGDGVFFICGTEIWDYIKSDGRLKEDDIAFIPVYMGIGDESKQGMCTGTNCYWSVNKNATEANINATLDFLNWLVTSSEGTKALAEMGYVIPYKNAVESDNPFVMTDRKMTESGKVPITINYPALPTESWRDEVNYEMGAYAANLGDWGDIYGEVVTVWTGEYAIK